MWEANISTNVALLLNKSNPAKGTGHSLCREEGLTGMAFFRSQGRPCTHSQCFVPKGRRVPAGSCSSLRGHGFPSESLE